VTKTTTNLLLMLITILGGTYFFIMCCNSCRVSASAAPLTEQVTAPVTPEATSYPFAFSDGAYAYNENENYNFNVSSSSFSTPVSQKVTEGIASLKTFLVENENKVITLNGYFKGDETNGSAFPNLGLARANTVKNHLVENGISSTQINTMGELMDGMVSKEGMFFGPISFGIGDKSATSEEEMSALYAKITADPLVLYFETNQAAINLSAEQRQKVADISKYLDKVTGASGSVVGHSDNVGPRADNIKLAQDRADFAKAYLAKNGIVASKINASSKGPDLPAESNATEAGRSKNRRTVVTLNK
jgi:outer membrane protein OmpA-like peptidoglycan-associated protein